ncbi:MAG: YbjN domain-containing protein [Chitinophagales bacterium]|nr:YbjN domain-containing protein [Bacteroidota bacterium]
MNESFCKVKDYLLELGLVPSYESEEDGLFVINNPSKGIQNLIIGCADPVLILEQFLFNVEENRAEVFAKLLQKNRDLVHGAFVLDNTGKRVLFRDTLQTENLDLNELEASLNALSLLLAEYAGEILSFTAAAH